MRRRQVAHADDEQTDHAWMRKRCDRKKGGGGVVIESGICGSVGRGQ